MKKRLALLMAGALLAMAALTGCTRQSPVEATTAAATEAEAAEGEAEAAADLENVKVGFLAPTLQTEFFIGIDQDIKANCEERGWDYMAVSFDNDSATAVTSIENMVTSGCNVIVAMVSDTSCDDALAQAQAQGVKIIESGVVTEVWDVCFNLDQYEVGVQIGNMAGEWINETLDGAGKVVVYTTYQNTDMQNRGQGIQDGIAATAPDAEILEVVDIGKDVVGMGTTTTETMLQKYPDLNCIAAYGDAAAVESNEAVKAAGKSGDSFGIFACDGTNQALKAITDGDPMHGTVRFQDMGGLVAEYTERLLNGETFDEPILMPADSITAANVAEFYTAE